MTAPHGFGTSPMEASRVSSRDTPNTAARPSSMAMETFSQPYAMMGFTSGISRPGGRWPCSRPREAKSRVTSPSAATTAGLSHRERRFECGISARENGSARSVRRAASRKRPSMTPGMFWRWRPRSLTSRPVAASRCCRLGGPLGTRFQLGSTSAMTERGSPACSPAAPVFSPPLRGVP